jgi:hypothetical protein
MQMMCAAIILTHGSPALTQLSFSYNRKVWGLITTDSQSACMSWRRAHLGTCNHILILSEFRCVVFAGCPRDCLYLYRVSQEECARLWDFVVKYTDITQNTYVQSWTVMEIMAREVWNFDSC